MFEFGGSTEYYDYKVQAWVDEHGQYVRCGHPEDMPCGCFGKIHAGEVAPKENTPCTTEY